MQKPAAAGGGDSDVDSASEKKNVRHLSFVQHINGFVFCSTEGNNRKTLLFPNILGFHGFRGFHGFHGFREIHRFS